MKKLLLISAFLIVISFRSGFSQPIPSSCQAPWALQQAYDHDVKNLAVKYMRNIQSPDTIFVTIPQSQQTPIIEGLAAIFNCGHPGRDSIFDMYCVHDIAYQPVTYGYIIGINTNASWLSAWQNLQTPTGLQVLDDLLVKYDLHITSWFTSLNAGVFSSSKLLNPYALEDSLQWASSYINYCEPDQLIGAAGHILYERDEIRKFKFYFQWNDCFDGCDNWHYWEYWVNPDCSVNYMGTGDWGVFGIEPLPAPINCNITTGNSQLMNESMDISVYPNPSWDKLYVNIPGEPSGNIMCEIYSSKGQLVQKFETVGKKQLLLDVSMLVNDMYILKIQYNKDIFVRRFVK